ncbi:MAG TPA: 3-hydroxyacyl-CoA dehydrogenase family protein [Myxococcaceae bacterium]|nr:3-hydroxyacyl-CoA dehydrogenase family protein [Myxococcaceae bacterium]
MSEIKSVGVLGAGTMGHGIAQVAAQAGYQTLLYDVTSELAQRGLQRISENLQRGIEKGKVKQQDKEQILKRLKAVADLPELAECGLIIEAIPEDLALKRSIFTRLSEVCSPRTILASNTSSLSVSEIAAAASHPERVVGMHFFNPVHIMRLLEIVRAEPTSDATIETVRGVAGRLGKETIVVRDRPGFASSRLGLALGLEAIRMVEQGVASAEDIDRAMELGYGYPMGPLKLGDLVGLDVRLAIAEYLHRELRSEVFRPPQLLKDMVSAGKLGRKSGQGFYKY